jgi:tetratricopeptide (TPR) repeat protein
MRMTSDAQKYKQGEQWRKHKDYAKANEWFLRAGDGGRIHYAKSLIYGLGVEKDYAKAKELLEKAIVATEKNPDFFGRGSVLVGYHARARAWCSSRLRCCDEVLRSRTEHEELWQGYA